MSYSFSEGSIKKIKLENVLTYDAVVVECGPKLNVIIGPNGSGKSTIVCAICLGMAGKTSFLGRAQNATEFIKYGKKRARIEITLHNPDGEDWTIAREISKEGGNTNTWSVNGRQASQKAVEELVARLNIQVGNLTQFLPQEKVADFAKMSEYELLENTEKAVGDPKMYERHQKLKESRTNAKSMEMEMTNLMDRLHQERNKNARIEQDVKSFEERQRILAKIEDLKVKQAWVEYEEKRQRYVTNKEEKMKAEKNLKALRAQHSPLQKKIDQAKANKDAIYARFTAKKAELREVAKKAEANGSEIDSLTDKYVEVQDELKFQKEREDARKNRLRDLKKQLEALETDLRNIDDTENVQPLLEKVNKTMREVTQQMGQISHQGDVIRIEIENHRRTINTINRDLQTLRNVENQRLQSLRMKHRETYDAVMWLRENKHQFKGTIHEPIMLCVNMKNPQMARYLENHIPFNDMRAFVCENSADMNHFMDIVRDQQGLRVNAVITPPGAQLHNFRPDHPIDRYRRFGFYSYLQEMFTCPDGVMKYLCKQYQVHKIPVGDNRTKEMVSEVIDTHPELNCFYTQDSQYITKRSRYDNSTSTKSSQLKNASLLTVSMDSQRENELLQQLQNETDMLGKKEERYTQLQNKTKQMDQNLNKLRDEKKQLLTRKDQKKRLQSQVESKRETIKNVECDVVNIEAEEEKARKKIAEINKKKLKNLQLYVENTEKCVEGCKAKVCLGLDHTEAIRLYKRLEADFRDQSQQLHQTEAEFERLKEQLNSCKTVAKKLLDKAKRASGTGPNEELSDRYKEAFRQLPDTLEEIEAQIHEHQVRADLTVVNDERVIHEFRKRKNEIEKLERDLEAKEHEKDRHQATIEEAKTQWLEPLQELIAKINTSFSRFFKSLKCVGEVDLHIPDNPEEYSKYGVRIKVKFRDSEPLRELSAHHQSGGERSVTTVLYMMSLQELARCPFRCVDEINQGMDPVNERKVFELVVKTVCKESTSQYFLLTPKLLPDLEYADHMTVLCVYNGQHMIKHTDWKTTHFLKRRRNLTE